MSITADLQSVFPPPHPAGKPFILGCTLIAISGLFFGRWLTLVGTLGGLFCWFFFRDPPRAPPNRPGAIVAPADGRVASVSPDIPPPELGLGATSRWRISIFLSVFNVHVNRIPATGTVTRIAYRHGTFLNASLDKASHLNERNSVALRLLDGQELAIVQIAGLIARRILCSLREGDAVQTGDRMGIIRFGSRTDIYLPEGVHPLVQEGQTMIGGETVIGELGS